MTVKVLISLMTLMTYQNTNEGTIGTQTFW